MHVSSQSSCLDAKAASGGCEAVCLSSPAPPPTPCCGLTSFMPAASLSSPSPGRGIFESSSLLFSAAPRGTGAHRPVLDTTKLAAPSSNIATLFSSLYAPLGPTKGGGDLACALELCRRDEDSEPFASSPSAAAAELARASFLSASRSCTASFLFSLSSFFTSASRTASDTHAFLLVSPPSPSWAPRAPLRDTSSPLTSRSSLLCEGLSRGADLARKAEEEEERSGTLQLLTEESSTQEGGGRGDVAMIVLLSALFASTVPAGFLATNALVTSSSLLLLHLSNFARTSLRLSFSFSYSRCLSAMPSGHEKCCTNLSRGMLLLLLLPSTSTITCSKETWGAILCICRASW
mmetsp:Transcript_8782/g.29321  ORF Transcript_8782/g.29321 Transcript_8782/m.29321 type:complete len:349 (+) Transcript_8782:1339-2385(+)